MFASEAKAFVAADLALLEIDLVADQHFGHRRSGAVDVQFVQPGVQLLEGTLLVGVVDENCALSVSVYVC